MLRQNMSPKKLLRKSFQNKNNNSDNGNNNSDEDDNDDEKKTKQFIYCILFYLVHFNLYTRVAKKTQRIYTQKIRR